MVFYPWLMAHLLTIKPRGHCTLTAATCDWSILCEKGSSSSSLCWMAITLLYVIYATLPRYSIWSKCERPRLKARQYFAHIFLDMLFVAGTVERYIPLYSYNCTIQMHAVVFYATAAATQEKYVCFTVIHIEQ